MVKETTRGEPERPQGTVAGASLTDLDVLGMVNRADIILTHGKSPTDWLIRWGTGSYWNHVAMVFLLKDVAQGYLRTFVLESVARQGVDIHPIDKYLVTEHSDGKPLVKKDPDLAILRFPDSALPLGRRVDFVRRVRGFALEEIDAKYGRRAILRNVEKILGPLGWLVEPVILTMRLRAALDNRRKAKAANDFICSGVVQYAYCRACFGANPVESDLWDQFFKDSKIRANLIVSDETRDGFDPKVSFQVLTERLKLTRPADFSQAAIDHKLLECVAQRKEGVWGRQLTER